MDRVRIKRWAIINVGEKVWSWKPWALLLGMEPGAAAWKNICWLLKTSMKYRLTHDPILPMPGIYLPNWKHACTNACSWMLAAALCIIVQQNRSSSLHQWGLIKTMKWCSLLEILSKARLENQTQRTVYYMILLIYIYLGQVTSQARK